MQDTIRLSFYAQPDGPVTGDSKFSSSVLIPGYGIIKLLGIILS